MRKKGKYLLDFNTAADTQSGKDTNTPLPHVMPLPEIDDIAERLSTRETAQLVNAVNAEGQTPLHLAVQAGKESLVRQLLKLGANVNAVDKEGNTPLHLAIAAHSEELMLLLIEHGADISKSASELTMPLLNCALKKTAGVPAVRILLDYGADPNAVGREEYTPSPLLWATSIHDVESLKLLLEAGANPDYANEKGTTALHISCMNSREDAIEVLLAAGANPNIKDTAGRTPLHLVATSALNVKLSQMLIENGADPLLKDITGRSAFDLAYKSDNKAIMEIFKKKLAEKGLVYTPPPPTPDPSTSWNIC